MIVYYLLIILHISFNVVNCNDDRGQNFTDLNPEDYKLTSNVIPLSYNLVITPNFKDNTFEGEVTILVQAEKTAQRSIVLLKKGLKIKDTWNLSIEGIPIVLPKNPLQEDPVTHKSTFSFANVLETNYRYNLFIEFSGKIDDNLKGFFKSNYRDGKVDKSVYGTQLTPIAARNLVPCFDEPHFKVKFKLTVKDIGLTNHVISNGVTAYEVDEGKEGEPKKRSVYFEETSIPISSHSFGFVISDFVVTEWEHLKYLSRFNNELEAINLLKQVADFEKFYSKWFDYPYENIAKSLEVVAFPDFLPSSIEALGSIYVR